MQRLFATALLATVSSGRRHDDPGSCQDDSLDLLRTGSGLLVHSLERPRRHGDGAEADAGSEQVWGDESGLESLDYEQAPSEFIHVANGMTCSRTNGDTYTLDGANGWPYKSLEDCKALCMSNSVPADASWLAKQQVCKFVVWEDDPDVPPGRCHLASSCDADTRTPVDKSVNTVQIWQKALTLTYTGCFANDGADRIYGYTGDTSVSWCSASAKAKGFAFFGMEYPQGYSIEGHARCYFLDNWPSMSLTPDSDCEADVVDGYRLGGASRLAVYYVTFQVAFTKLGDGSCQGNGGVLPRRCTNLGSNSISQCPDLCSADAVCNAFEIDIVEDGCTFFTDEDCPASWTAVAGGPQPVVAVEAKIQSYCFQKIIIPTPGPSPILAQTPTTTTPPEPTLMPSQTPTPRPSLSPGPPTGKGLPRPSPRPTPRPTLKPSPSPTPAPTPTNASESLGAGQQPEAGAHDDPHIRNLAHEEFSVLQQGNYTLLRVPLDPKSEAVVHMQATISSSEKSHCAMYIKWVTLEGSWFGDKMLHVRPLRRDRDGRNSAGTHTLWPLSFYVARLGQWPSAHDRSWISFESLSGDGPDSDALRSEVARSLPATISVEAVRRKELGNLQEAQAFYFHVGPPGHQALISAAQASHQALNMDMSGSSRLGLRLGGLLGTEKHDPGVEVPTKACRAEKGRKRQAAKASGQDGVRLASGGGLSELWTRPREVDLAPDGSRCSASWD